ncbi:unnamed protein product [Alopecurus aequalis]
MVAAGSPLKKMKSARTEPLDAGNPATAAAEGGGPGPTAEDQELPLPGADGGSPSKKRKSTRIEPLEAAAEGGSAAEYQESPKEMEDVGSPSKKWKSARIEPLEAENSAAEGGGSGSAAENQEPPLPGTDGEDRISQLPVALLQSIISLLPTKDGACTQLLASAWRELWRSAPLNIDHQFWNSATLKLDCFWRCTDGKNLADVVSQILSAHKGPARRFRAPVYHHRGNGRATADDWLKSSALRNLQELELCGFQLGLPLLFRDPRPSPVGAFPFSQTLVVATIGNCQFPDIAAQPIRFPKLKKLCLEQVTISESSLHTMIAGCLALECLLIELSNGFRCLRINSITIRNICLKSCPGELIIENAPCLERLLQLIRHDSHTSVIAAPKLEILGWLSSYYCTTLMLGSTVIQGLRVDTQKSVLPTVKILSVDMGLLSLDTIINLMRCFPCLERLYIKCPRQGETNVWRGKHRLLLKSKSFDICLKRIYWRCYFGTKSHVSFATFFVENAKVLELMTFQVHPEENYNEVYIAQQSKVLKLDSKASRGAQFRFTPDDSHREATDFCLNDLDLADPFERKDPSRFIDLS